jgi:hypothetical protein
VPAGTTTRSSATSGSSSTAWKRSPGTAEALDSGCCNLMVIDVPAGIIKGARAGAEADDVDAGRRLALAAASLAVWLVGACPSEFVVRVPCVETLLHPLTPSKASSNTGTA